MSLSHPLLIFHTAQSPYWTFNTHPPTASAQLRLSYILELVKNL